MQCSEASTLLRQCPLWVKSRHVRCTRACTLYPQKRHRWRCSACMLWAKSGHPFFFIIFRPNEAGQCGDLLDLWSALADPANEYRPRSVSKIGAKKKATEVDAGGIRGSGLARRTFRPQ